MYLRRSARLGADLTASIGSIAEDLGLAVGLIDFDVLIVHVAGYKPSACQESHEMPSPNSALRIGCTDK